jgi:hypothetical protein
MNPSEACNTASSRHSRLKLAGMTRGKSGRISIYCLTPYVRASEKGMITGLALLSSVGGVSEGTLSLGMKKRRG